VSTMCRQSSRITACLPPGRYKANIQLAKVCLHCTKPGVVARYLPDGRFQSGGSPRITAATARWWSSCGELRAICPKSRKRLSVTRWERGRHQIKISKVPKMNVKPEHICSLIQLDQCFR